MGMLYIVSLKFAVIEWQKDTLVKTIFFLEFKKN